MEIPPFHSLISALQLEKVLIYFQLKINVFCYNLYDESHCYYLSTHPKTDRIWKLESKRIDNLNEPDEDDMKYYYFCKVIQNPKNI